jgi:hypothetical protein
MNESEIAPKQPRKVRSCRCIDRCEFIPLVNRDITGLGWVTPTSFAQQQPSPSTSPAFTVAVSINETTLNPIPPAASSGIARFCTAKSDS